MNRFACALIPAAALIFAASSAADPITKQPIGGVSASQLDAAKLKNLQQAVKPAPKNTSLQIKANQIAAAAHLTVPPVLGTPVSLTPYAGAVRGKAGLSLADVGWFQASPVQDLAGSMTDAENVQPAGYVRFGNDIVAGFAITFNAEKGKRYAFDCRTNVGRLDWLLYKAMGKEKPLGAADIATDASLHNLYTVGPMAESGWYMAYARVWSTTNKYNFNLSHFWGCDVIPF